MAFVSYIRVIGSSVTEWSIAPAPRDDIEFLGYSLLHLASGDLPWFYNVWHGTRKTQYDQVWIKKQRYSGADLAPDGLSFIGAMIDHARSLNFDELPNYKLFRLQVQEARERAGLLDSFVVDWNIPSDALIGPWRCGRLQQICFMEPNLSL